MFDASGSGFINSPDVQQVLRSMGQDLDLIESKLCKSKCFINEPDIFSGENDDFVRS